MLSDEDVKTIEANVAASTEPSMLRRWVDALLEDRRERIRVVERARQRLKPFAYFRDLIKP